MTSRVTSVKMSGKKIDLRELKYLYIYFPESFALYTFHWTEN